MADAVSAEIRHDFNEKSAPEAFLAAVRRGDEITVKKMLAEGADVNTRDAAGTSALDQAIWASKKDMARLLLAHDADPNAANKIGRTPLMTAVLIFHADLAEELLNKGADVNHVAKDGHTALMTAAWAGDMKSVVLLIDRGADNLRQTGFNQDAMMMAYDRGNREIGDFLIKHMKEVDWPAAAKKYAMLTAKPAASAPAA